MYATEKVPSVTKSSAKENIAHIHREVSRNESLPKCLVPLGNQVVMVHISDARPTRSSLCVSDETWTSDDGAVRPVIAGGLGRNDGDGAFGFECGDCILDVVGEGVDDDASPAGMPMSMSEGQDEDR